VLWINIISMSIQWHKRDVQQLNIAMMFWMSTFLRNIRTSFVQQPIVEPFLGHLTLEERQEFVNANSTKEKIDKSQILMYQLLNILIKCLMFCKHVSI
jgi:hypothetical protein